MFTERNCRVSLDKGSLRGPIMFLHVAHCTACSSLLVRPRRRQSPQRRMSVPMKVANDACGHIDASKYEYFDHDSSQEFQDRCLPVPALVRLNLA